jgi:hypothetical protein
VKILLFPHEFKEKSPKGRDRITIREMMLMKMLQSVALFER